MSKPVITSYTWSPDRGGGLVRDMRVRWAMEEVGQPYDVRYLDWGEQKETDHRARSPFGQVPTYEEGGLVLFESGASVLHIAETWPGLLPADPAARFRPGAGGLARRADGRSARGLALLISSFGGQPNGDEGETR